MKKLLAFDLILRLAAFVADKNDMAKEEQRKKERERGRSSDIKLKLMQISGHIVALGVCVMYTHRRRQSDKLRWDLAMHQRRSIELGIV